jgi:hypothetical protein
MRGKPDFGLLGGRQTARGLSAADKLRLLASALNIPQEIPDCLLALNAKSGSKWQDSADAITGIRNDVVHPHAKKSLPDHSYFEAWQLAMWHLDTALLRVCGCGKMYSRRKFQVGTSEQPEWVTWEPSDSECAGEPE